MNRRLMWIIAFTFCFYTSWPQKVMAQVAECGGRGCCKTFSAPFQGWDADGNVARNTYVLSPPFAFHYPARIAFPAGALSLGVEHWFSRVLTDAPKNYVEIAGYHDRADRHLPGAHDNSLYTDEATNDGPNSSPASFNLSRILNPGEAYAVKIQTFVDYPVLVKLAITYNVCFRTPDELRAYGESVER